MTHIDLLPGVPEDYVRARLGRSPGNEILSGKFASDESSAALAANFFAWFHDRPEKLPSLPGLPSDFRATRVEIKYNAAFPWRGGHHPWLDAAVFAENRIIGIESKRYEPFRDKKTVSFSKAYDRPVWGDAMGPFIEMKDRLAAGDLKFERLDAAQLVKHAFGLVTEGARMKLAPTLFYLFAEPRTLKGRSIDAASRLAHREEIGTFAAAIEGAAVGFLAASYGEWIGSWRGVSGDLQRHGEALIERFSL